MLRAVTTAVFITLGGIGAGLAQDGGAAAELPIGEVAQPTEGETYVREEFGDWQLRCIRRAEGPEPCQMYQLLSDGQGNAVAEVTLFAVAPGNQAAAGATVVTPLETLLTRQVTISVDGAPGKRYPFVFCNQIGCYARLGLTEGDVAAYRAGSAATIQIVPAGAPDQTVDLSMSLSGFTAAFEAMTSP